MWQKFSSALPRVQQDVYYTPEYLELYANDTTSANCYAYVEQDNIYIYPFMLGEIPGARGYFDICTPYGYGGPVANTTDQGFIRLAYETFYREAVKRNVIAEVIKFHPLLDNSECLADIYHGKILRMCQTVYVDLTENEDRLWSAIYTHANRKNINKALRQGIKVRFDQSQEAWGAFLELYEATMIENKAAGFYFFSPGYYRSLRETMAEHYVLVSCWLDGRAIAVMLVLLGNTMAHCHLLGIDRAVLSTGVGNYLHHELIGWCRGTGYRYLHIGGGRGNEESDPLLSYKKNFSDRTATFYVGESIFNEEVYQDVCARWENLNVKREPSGRLLKYRH
ncbi:MAG: GNAT family N-acetyltransferase [Candidatus Omnitrophica bacterium]|nr:GNAT family N-acetyltransferase [Candidatus Omnitrophota bacterium]